MKKRINILLLLLCIASCQIVYAQTKQTAEDRAVDLVSQQREVKDWERELDMARKQHKHSGEAGFMVTDHQASLYTVQAFESFPDHNATFHWYTVDLKTGTVKQTM